VRVKGKSEVIPYQILVIVVVDGGGERGTKTVVLLLEAPYKDGGPRALAGHGAHRSLTTRPLVVLLHALS
jgi:hypothetical protein